MREVRALNDNLYPSRNILGCSEELGASFVQLMLDAAEKTDVETIYMPPKEAEADKLFGITYLAMRVSFVNDLDSYATPAVFDTASIIGGVRLEKRIAGGYDTPSFGYGRYCLPKDTTQLHANYDQPPQNLIQAIISSNLTRKEFIIDAIIRMDPRVIGITNW